MKDPGLPWAGELAGGGPENDKIRERLEEVMRIAYHAGRAEGTRDTSNSHLGYCERFCRISAVDVEKFGLVETGATSASIEQLNEEMDILTKFAEFVVAFPRRKKKELNTTPHAEQCIASVRSHYAAKHGRRPGLRAGSNGGSQLQLVLKGLKNMSPSKKGERLPILQHHLRADRRHLDISNNGLHRVCWALWLTQWQGVLRSSDVISRLKWTGRTWIPSKEIHRGRLAVGDASDARGEIIGPRLPLTLKPNKTDQGGEKQTVTFIVLDTSNDALSTAHAIREMLHHDIEAIKTPEETALFRDPTTGMELTYETSVKLLKGESIASRISAPGEPTPFASEGQQRTPIFRKGDS